MTIRTKLRSIYHQTVPDKIRARVSKIRHPNKTHCSKPNQTKKQSYRVFKKDSDRYLEALVSVSQQLSQEQNLTFQILNTLHEAFANRQVRSHLLELHWWADFVFAATNFDETSIEAQENLISYIDELPLDTFRFWELLHIYSLAIRVGLFRVGYALRYKAREVAINSLKKGEKLTNDERIAGIAAQMEIGEYAEARQNILQLSDQLAREKQVLCYLYRLIAPENEAKLMPKSELEVDDSEQDKKFRDFVSGKSIAVVGPAKTDQEDAQEIDSYDLVVRCNYREKGVGVDNKVKGLRCDVTYFNNQQAKYFYDQENFNWPYEIKWAVCKSACIAEKISNKINSSLKENNDHKKLKHYAQFKTRSIKEVNKIIFNTDFNAIPNIALDLSKFKPNSIQVFHADLMLTVERISGYFPDTLDRDSFSKTLVAMPRALVAHDPITQYNTLNKLWTQEKIEGDTRFSEVMSLGEKEYMRQLQVIYGNAGRIHGK